MGDAEAPVKQVGQRGIEVDLDHDRDGQDGEDQWLFKDLLSTFTLATSRRPSIWNTPGSACPSATPATMHSTTHAVSQRSKNPIVGVIAGAVTVAACTLILFLLGRGLAKFAQLRFERERVKRFEPQPGEGLDPALEDIERGFECPALIVIGALDGGRIVDPPVRRYRPARPYWTSLACRAGADRDNKIELGCAGTRELVPTLASEPRRGKALLLQQLEGQRIDVAHRMTSRRVRFETPVAQGVQKRLRKDAAGGVARAQK